VLLLIILTFIAVVLVMTGALVPVLMYCAGIIAVIYVVVLVKNLIMQFLTPHPEENAPRDSAAEEVAPDVVTPEEPGEPKE
jgi:predicted tellurium resistance membrane protein TerC